MDSTEKADKEQFEDEEDFDQPDLSLYKLVKRVPEHPPIKKNDIYISRSMNIAVLKKRVLKLLDNLELDHVTLHGLGAAINLTITLALNLQEESNGTFELSCFTSSVKLVDEYQPLADDLQPITNIRYNSSIHIKIKKKKL